MEDFLDTLLLLGFLLGCAYVVAQMSKEKDVGFWTLFVTSLFLTPFVGLFIGLISKRRLKEGEVSTQAQEGFLSRFMNKKDKTDDKTDLEMPDFDKSSNGKT